MKSKITGKGGKDSTNNMMCYQANSKFDMPYNIHVHGEHVTGKLESHFRENETIAPKIDVRVTWEMLEYHNPALIGFKQKIFELDRRYYPDQSWDNLANLLAKMICDNGIPVTYTKAKEKDLGTVPYGPNPTSQMPISFHTKKSSRPLLAQLSNHLQTNTTTLPVRYEKITWKILVQHNPKFSQLPSHGLSDRALNRVANHFVNIVHENHLAMDPQQEQNQSVKTEEKITV